MIRERLDAQETRSECPSQLNDEDHDYIREQTKTAKREAEVLVESRLKTERLQMVEKMMEIEDTFKRQIDEIRHANQKFEGDV